MQSDTKQFGKKDSNTYSGGLGRPDIEPAASGSPGAVSFFLGIMALRPSWPGAALRAHWAAARLPVGHILWAICCIQHGASPSPLRPQLQPGGIGLGVSGRVARAAGQAAQKNPAPPFSP